MNGKRPPPLGHIRSLDGLRGIAIAAVVVDHLFGLDGGPGHGGFFGVDLFFVLSGFLITTLLLEEHESTGRISLKAFWVRRARRLLPAAGALVALFVAIMAAAGELARAGIIVAAGALYVGNIVRAAAPTFRLGPVDHFWSLAEEEQFYLLWPPLLIIALRRIAERRLLRFLLLAAGGIAVYRLALGLAGANVYRLYFAPDTHADGLVLGCAGAVYRRSGRRLPGARVGFLALACVLATFALAHQDSHGLLYVLPAFNVAALILVLAVAKPGALASAVSTRPLVYLGVISYSLYVWHQFARWLLAERFPWIALPFSILLAVGSYHLIEQPLRYRRTAQRIAKDASTAGALSDFKPA